MGRKKTFNSYPFSYRQEIELEVSTLTNLGLGLGRVILEQKPDRQAQGEPDAGCQAPKVGGQIVETEGNDAAAKQGWVVMVPFALPGERVRVRVYRNHKNFSEADLVAVLRPSLVRVAQKCELYGRCGGCQYQHLSYAEQLSWKRRQVEELLKHMAGIEHPVNPVIGSPREYGYRSKITPHFNCGKPLSEAEASDPAAVAAAAAKLPIGFLRQGTRFDLVDVPRCEIATDGINARLGDMRADVRRRFAAGEFKRGATLLLRDASGEVVTDYDATITEKVGNLSLRFLARDFFQNNPFILPAFTSYVREQAAASGARFLIDAYCGSGLFALSSASAFERVAGVEISATSVDFARANASANGVGNVSFLAGDASAIFAGIEFPHEDTVVVIDPPRKGCDESFLTQLFAFKPRGVVYVSCDPATQMRDLKLFLQAGYKPTAVQPFDLFPQTRHLECVTTLKRT